MPTETPLSERLGRLRDHIAAGRMLQTAETCSLLDDAARLLAPLEQPEVARLLARAGLVEGCNQSQRARELRAHAAALVALADAQAKVKRLEALREDWRAGAGWGYVDELDAALAGAGGEREVTE